MNILLLLLPCEYLYGGLDKNLRFEAAATSQFEGFLKNENVDYYDIDAKLLKHFGRCPIDFKIAYTDVDFLNKIYTLLDSTFADKAYDIILCSLPTYFVSNDDTYLLYFNYNILNYLKNRFRTKIVLGGLLTTLLSDGKFREIDFLNVVDKICTGKLETSTQLYEYLDLTPKVSTYVPKASLTNLEDITYSYSEVLNFYNMPVNIIKEDAYIRQTSMKTMHGCVGTCAFCTESNSKFKYIDINLTKETILKKLDLGYNSIFFKDNAFNPTRKAADNFCNWIIKNNLHFSWSTSCRFHNTDYDFFKMAYDAGCRRLCFGTELPSNKMLEYINKGITCKDISKGLSASHDAGIWNLLNFIFGLPYETYDDLSQALDFIFEHEDYIDHYVINKFYLSFNSDFAKNPKKYNLGIVDNSYVRLHGLQDNNDNKQNYHYGKTYYEINGKNSTQIEHYKDNLMQVLYPFIKQCNRKNVPLHLVIVLYDIFKCKHKVNNFLNNYFSPRVREK